MNVFQRPTTITRRDQWITNVTFVSETNPTSWIRKFASRALNLFLLYFIYSSCIFYL